MSRFRRVAQVAVACALAVLAQSCSGWKDGREDVRRELLRSWGEDMLLVRYAQLDLRAGQLDGAALGFCAAPDEAGLEAVRDAWWAARGPLKETEVFAFGPYTDEPLRYGPRIDFWPARPDVIAETLTGDVALERDDLSGVGAAAKGFPAIEVLLWPPSNALTAFVDDERRCQYLVALTADLQRQARLLAEAWEPAAGSYLAELVDAGRGSESYETLQQALGEVVNRIGFTLENIRRDKLLGPLGAEIDTPEPSLLESRYSGRSLEDIADNLRGIEVLLAGEIGSGILGLEEALRRRRPELMPIVLASLDEARTALAALEPSLEEALFARPDDVLAAADALAELQRLVQVDVVGALALSLAFNDTDGD